jgi:predicted DNA-binding protein (MmcQ/YjbR family)
MRRRRSRESFIMNLEAIRKYCKTLPHVEEDVKWGHDLCFLIGRKMFCVLNLEPQRGDKSLLAFKATPEEFAELVEVEGIIPAPYMARNYWVALERYSALPWGDMQRRIARSYELVKATLPKKLQAELGVPTSPKPATAKKKAGKARLSKRR